MAHATQKCAPTMFDKLLCAVTSRLMMYTCEKCEAESWSEFEGGVCDVCADEADPEEDVTANK